MQVSEQAMSVEVRIATRLMKVDAEGFTDSMTHVVNDEDKPLCGTKAKVNLIDGSFRLGELAWRDEITGGEDDQCFACHQCLKSADARIRKGWEPSVESCV